ncbi:hypothetical protein H634G_02036 [Metarhizium anisopliae BRIP 53293]|uniref:Uncharacterized protein n=1 Tax=Metarhizium anisopliae BRIP 53293 TaxID=1291518 RepID=A0A0D9P9K2_METAN|nr:hypothetical protein H634G_02036 [Metarhizium anisopliae BRIP 53293]KJK95147.1 hypothetical protein H633G_00950 [Metarhizium anisopliae BRIP 53284]
MVIFKSLVLALSLPLKAMAGLADAPIPGYDVVDLTWEVEVFPGHFENLTGTAEQVHRAARAMNPGWKPRTAPDPRGRNLAKRVPLFNWSKVICGAGTLGWHPCKVRRIEQGIEYLRGLAGVPRNGPGPETCARVSCSYQAAIWWCNNAPFARALGSWDDIADSAQLMVWKCSTGRPYADKYMTGQAFSTENWDVIIRQDEC